MFLQAPQDSEQWPRDLGQNRRVSKLRWYNCYNVVSDVSGGQVEVPKISFDFTSISTLSYSQSLSNLMEMLHSNHSLINCIQHVKPNPIVENRLL